MTNKTKIVILLVTSWLIAIAIGWAIGGLCIRDYTGLTPEGLYPEYENTIHLDLHAFWQETPILSYRIK